MKQRINWSREFLLLLRSSFKQKISFPLFWREIGKSGGVRWKISILPKLEKLWSLRGKLLLKKGGDGKLIVGEAGASCDWELEKSSRERFDESLTEKYKPTSNAQVVQGKCSEPYTANLTRFLNLRLSEWDMYISIYLYPFYLEK